MQQSMQMAAMPGVPPANITTEQIQKYLDENKNLILAILENQNLGKLSECAQYQAILQKNLLYLAAIADAQPQSPSVRPQTPGTMSPGVMPPGGMPPGALPAGMSPQAAAQFMQQQQQQQQMFPQRAPIQMHQDQAPGQHQGMQHFATRMAMNGMHHNMANMHAEKDGGNNNNEGDKERNGSGGENNEGDK